MEVRIYISCASQNFHKNLKTRACIIIKNLQFKRNNVREAKRMVMCNLNQYCYGALYIVYTPHNGPLPIYGVLPKIAL